MDSIEKANAYFNNIFLPETWKNKFTIKAQTAGVMYRPCPKKMDLDQTFCLKFDRKIKRDHTLLFANNVYGITVDLPHSIVRKIAEIRIYSDGRMAGYYGCQDLELKAERKGCWGRHADAKSNPGLTPGCVSLVQIYQYTQAVN